jgi:hypothetical protein
MSGCRDPMPCPDCVAEDDGNDNDNDNDDGNDDTPLPDLPCGGADLLTDSLNCGTCGQECALWYPGSEYEAGTCSAGVCGPGWSTCYGEYHSYNTCDEVCAASGEGCVPNGCSGYTGLLFELFAFDPGCDAYSDTPVATLTGCDEPIPWMSTGDEPRQVMCCCDFQ